MAHRDEHSLFISRESDRSVSFALAHLVTALSADAGPESVFTCGLRRVRGNEFARVRTKAKRRLRVDSTDVEENGGGRWRKMGRLEAKLEEVAGG